MAGTRKKAPSDPVKDKIIVWVSPQGLETPVAEMSDRHLRNSIALIRRKLHESPDMAEVSERFWSYWAEMLPILLAEQRRRKENGIIVEPVS